jgi:WD40 repeat protein
MSIPVLCFTSHRVRWMAAPVLGLAPLGCAQDRPVLVLQTGHGVTKLAFSLDGQTLASGSGDYTVLFWDVASGKFQHTLNQEVEPRSRPHCLYVQ